MAIPKPWHPPTAPELKEPVSIGIGILALFESVTGLAVGFGAASAVGSIALGFVGVAASRSIAFGGVHVAD